MNSNASFQIEDTSDEFFADMHEKCEIQEKKRFQSFVQYPSRRSRGSRNDSGPLTPDMVSSDVNIANESSDGALKIEEDSRQRSFTLSSSGGSHTNLASSLREEVFRRRSSSASLRRSSVSVGTDDLSMDYDEGEVVDPWPIRTFPLSEEQLQELKVSISLSEEENTTYLTRNKISSNSSLVELNNETNVTEGATTCEAMDTHVSVPQSPNSSNGSQVSEDPNDPEWTVGNGDKFGDRNGIKFGHR